MKCVIAIAAVSSLLAASATSNSDCRWEDPFSLQSCVRRILDTRVHTEPDSLELPDHHDGELSVTSVRMRGLSDYSTAAVDVALPEQPGHFNVHLTVSWAAIRASMDLRLHGCDKLGRCATVQGLPAATVGTSNGTVSMLFQVIGASQGPLTLRVVHRNIGVDLSTVTVHPNLNHFEGDTSVLFPHPEQTVVSKLESMWWPSDQAKVETAMHDVLRELTRDLTKQLNQELNDEEPTTVITHTPTAPTTTPVFSTTTPPPAVTLSPAEAAFMAEFESLTLPTREWTHEAHVRVAWNYLRLLPGRDAEARIKRGVQRYLTEHRRRVPRRYHETITAAFIRVIQAAMRRSPDTESFETFYRRNPQLHGMEIIFQYYSPSRLFSHSARRQFVSPDRRPLPALE